MIYKVWDKIRAPGENYAENPRLKLYDYLYNLISLRLISPALGRIIHFPSFNGI